MLFKKLSRNNLAKTGVNYSIASTLYSLSTMVVGFLNMRWIGPEHLGIWQSVAVVNAYIPFMQLGIQSGLNIELPKLLGANRMSEAKEMVRTTLSFAFILSTLFTIISIVCVAILFFKGVDDKVIWGAIAIAIIAICQCFHLHYIATYRSAKAFDKLTRIFYIRCVVTVALIPLMYYYGYYGLIVYNIISEVLMVSLLWYFAPYKHETPKFSSSVFTPLLKKGVILSVVRFLTSTIESMPRLILLKFGTVVSVGLFSPALTIGTFMNMIPNQLSQFLHPQFGYKYGQSGHARDMWPYFKKITFYAPLILLPIALMGWICIPYIIEWVFPKYVESIGAIRIMLLGFMFSTSYLSRGFLFTIKAHKEIILLQLIDILLFGGIPVLLITIFPGHLLVMTATGISVAYFFSYNVNILLIRRTIFMEKYNIAANE